MKIYKTNEIKNIALLGSKGSGKTTLAESMLYECGVIKRRGTIEAGNTVCDYFPVEKEYGYSVFSTVFYAEFLNKKLNVIDCPGADDFVGNAITALNVTDTGVIVINGQYGVEVGTQNIFRTASSIKKPIIFAINQLDGEKADYDNVIEQMKEIFGSKVVPIQYPLQCGPGFNAMVDVLLMKKYSWGPDGGVPVIEDIPAEEMERAMELHKALVEAAAENDESLMEKFFETEHLTEDEMRMGIRKGLIDRSIYPVFCVSAAKDMGVRRMMEFLGNVVPFVEDMPAPVNTAGDAVEPKADGPLSVFMFKTTVEPHIGEVSYFKVMSGTLRAGADLDNVTRGGKERFAQIFCVCGQIKTAVDALEAGDIGAAVKLKDARTNTPAPAIPSTRRAATMNLTSSSIRRLNISVLCVLSLKAMRKNSILSLHACTKKTRHGRSSSRRNSNRPFFRDRENFTCALLNGVSRTTTNCPLCLKNRKSLIVKL